MKKRIPDFQEVDDWVSGKKVKIDIDEALRLKRLLYDKACTVVPKYIYLSPESQRKSYGCDKKGMVKNAYEDRLISKADIREVGLNPKDYDIT